MQPFDSGPAEYAAATHDSGTAAGERSHLMVLPTCIKKAS